jgi:hypothetical protein
LQIGATAAFQGQTAAATIGQSNVMTAVQAAAASGAGAGAGGSSAGTAAGAGSGGTGGGLSATTVAIVGGAAAGGALAARQLIGATTNFQGDIAGNTTDTFNRANPCTNTTRWTGQLSLALNIDGTDVSGVDAKVRNATNVVISSTCPQGNIGFSNPWGFSGDRPEGTTSAIRFRGTDTGVGYSNSYDFLGALSGDTITGTLTITMNTTAGNVTGIGVIPVTLQKIN